MDLDLLKSIKDDLKYFLAHEERKDILENIIKDIDFIVLQEEELEDIPF
jgi:hypothetical protein